MTLRPGRAAGALYLLMAILGAFTLIYVPSTLIVPGNAAATASNILAHETLYRASIAAGLISAVVFVFLARALYELLKDVDRAHASLMVTLVMISVAVGFALTVNDIAALWLLRGDGLLAGLDPQNRQGLAMLLLSLSNAGTLVSEVFWGLWLFPFGTLVMRSGFIPRILGVLLIANGVAYLLTCFVGLLAPAYADVVNRVAFIAELGEVWIMLWLLIKGVKVQPASAAAS